MAFEAVTAECASPHCFARLFSEISHHGPNPHLKGYVTSKHCSTNAKGLSCCHCHHNDAVLAPKLAAGRHFHHSATQSMIALQDAPGLPIVVFAVKHGHNKLFQPEHAQVCCKSGVLSVPCSPYICMQSAASSQGPSRPVGAWWSFSACQAVTYAGVELKTNTYVMQLEEQLVAQWCSNNDSCLFMAAGPCVQPPAEQAFSALVDKALLHLEEKTKPV